MYVSHIDHNNKKNSLMGESTCVWRHKILLVKLVIIFIITFFLKYTYILPLSITIWLFDNMAKMATLDELAIKIIDMGVY